MEKKGEQVALLLAEDSLAGALTRNVGDPDLTLWPDLSKTSLCFVGVFASLSLWCVQ